MLLYVPSRDMNYWTNKRGAKTRYQKSVHNKKRKTGPGLCKAPSDAIARIPVHEITFWIQYVHYKRISIY